MKNFCRKVLLVCICVFSVVGAILFAACTPDKPQGDTITYTVTVTNENDEAVPNVRVRLTKGSAKYTYVTTDAEGKASFDLTEDTYDVDFNANSLPEGYTAPEGVKVSKDEPNATAKLVKKLAFKVTLLDEDGNPFYRDGVSLAVCEIGGSCRQTTALKKDGTWAYYPTAKDVANNAEYKILINLIGDVFDEFTFDGDARDPLSGSYYDGEHFKYDEKNPDQSITEITITIKSAKPTSKVTLTGAGERNVTVESAETHATVYFSPALAGKYEISSTGDYDTRVEYYANEISMVKLGEDDDSGEGKNFKLGGDNFDIDAGATCLFHIFVKAEAGKQFPATIGIKITRLGDTANVDREYKKVTPAQLGTEKYANGTGTLTYVDLSKKQTIVKGDDGYYHLGDKNGAVLVVKLKGEFRDEFGEFVYKSASGKDIEYTFLMAFSDSQENIFWDYTEFLEKYVDKCNDKGVYAVNDELKTMLERWAANNITDFTLEDERVNPVAEGNEWLIPCGYYA